MTNMINLKVETPEDLSEFKVKPVMAMMRAVDIKANVGVVFDNSISMEAEYEEGHPQHLADRGVGLAITLDPDKKVDIFVLNGQNGSNYVGTIDPESFRGWVAKNIVVQGNTPFSPALRAIFDRYDNGDNYTTYKSASVNTVKVVTKNFITKVKEFFSVPKVKVSDVATVVDNAASDPVSKRKLPTLILFVTDGECNQDDVAATTRLILDNANGDVFIQFIGLGEGPLAYLHNLQTQGIKNIGFFRIPCEDEDAVIDDGWLYKNCLGAFTTWERDRNRNND